MISCTLKTAVKRFVRALQIAVFVYRMSTPAPAHAQSNAEFLQQLNQQMGEATAAYNDGMRIAKQAIARQNAEMEKLRRRAANGDKGAEAEYDRRIEAQSRHAIAVLEGEVRKSEGETRRTQDYYRRQWQQDYHNYMQNRDWALQEARKAAARGDLDSAGRYASQADSYGQKANEYRSHSH